jgi:hypothetical protein
MKIRLLALVTALAVGGCGPHGAPTASAEAELARIEIATPVVTYALDNGLRVIQHADHREALIRRLSLMRLDAVMCFTSKHIRRFQVMSDM